MPLTRPSFRRTQQPLLRVRVRRPLLLSFRPDDQPSFLYPFILPQQRSLRESHLYLELHRVLASQQPPVLLPRRRPLRVLSRHPFRSPQRRLAWLLQQADERRPLRLAHRPPVLHLPGSSERHSARLRLLALLSAGRAGNRGLPCRSCSADDKRSDDERNDVRYHGPGSGVRMDGGCLEAA